MGSGEDVVDGKPLNCGGGHSRNECSVFLKKMEEGVLSHTLITSETSVSQLLFPSLILIMDFLRDSLEVFATCQP